MKGHDLPFSQTPPTNPLEEQKCVFWSWSGARGAHMMQQLLVLSLLKEEVRSSALLGRWRRRLESRRVGLCFMGGCSLLRHVSAAERNTLWMLFSDVNAEHSRYTSAPTCFANKVPYIQTECSQRWGKREARSLVYKGRVWLTDLLMGDGRQSLIGQLHQCANICTQVCLAAD